MSEPPPQSANRGREMHPISPSFRANALSVRLSDSVEQWKKSARRMRGHPSRLSLRVREAFEASSRGDTRA